MILYFEINYFHIIHITIKNMFYESLMKLNLYFW